MRNYNDNILELLKVGIETYTKKDSYLNYEKEDEKLRLQMGRFFKLGQEFIERKDMGFAFENPILFYSDNLTRNAVARKHGKYLLIEVFKGLFTWMNDFYLPKEEKFEHESIAVFKEITQIKGVSPAEFLLQLVTLFVFYHEAGHLVQNSGQMLDEEYAEELTNDLSAEQVKVRHIRELDADWHASHCIAMHVKEFSEIHTPEGKVIDPSLVFNIASLALAGIYMFFISLGEKKPEIYLEEKSHPHPSVRLSYVIHFFFGNLSANLPHGIDQAAVLKNAIVISALLMDEEDKENIVEQFSRRLYEKIDEVERYIKKIMGNAESYPYTCSKLLKKPAA